MSKADDEPCASPAGTWLEWARASLARLATAKAEPPWDDLTALGEMVGDAGLVAFGEGVHADGEPLEFRNRLLRYLIEEKGFTAIAIESGLAESRAIHDYVRGGPGELDAIVADGISWGFDELVSTRVLISWIRDYNDDVGNQHKINFYGFDMSGAPTSVRPYWSQDKVLEHVFGFLNAVDSAASRAFRSRLSPFLASMQFHSRQVLDSASSYGTLTQTERDALTATIADLVTWIERHEAKYMDISTAEVYAWAYRAAIGARQRDCWLREFPIGWMTAAAHAVPDDALPDFFSNASDVRDRAQADNLDWIIEREGPAGKVLVSASRYHLSAAPVTRSPRRHGQGREQQVAGTYLRRRFGKQLVIIGNLVGRNEMAGTSAPESSLDGAARHVGPSMFVLDLRKAPLPVKNWFDQELELVAGGQTLSLSVGRAFDILLYTDAVSSDFSISTGGGIDPAAMPAPGSRDDLHDLGEEGP